MRESTSRRWIASGSESGAWIAVWEGAAGTRSGPSPHTAPDCEQFTTHSEPGQTRARHTLRGKHLPHEKSSRDNVPPGSVAILPLQTDKKETLAAAAGAAAIAALITASIARHDGAAFRTQRRIRGHHIERQLLLRIGLRGTQRHALARLAHGIFRTQELGAHPAEDIIHDGFRVRDLLIPRPPARLESHVGELIH